MEEVNRLIKFYKAKGEEIRFTITGHSLGGALALLNAYEATTSISGLPISVIPFGAPRVGNLAFKEKLDEMGVKTLRIVLKQDIVPKFPRWNAQRDVALVNKATDMLIKELRIPKIWYQLPYKGLVLNKHGRWVKPSREPEDVPSPLSVASKNELH
ncbi:hypothetical protein SO802_006873 [Lithocarpus litseifolius]|uniref:Fungal lipase-type domain-containing protein n=1 Tax=Lithocarpus litseifolius TaxID=425828 RepID=A0AAW2DR30_9ROSI